MNTKPLYTTIRTENLEQLMSAKYILDNITKGIVQEKHLRIVCDAMLKAKTKHPHFANVMTDESIESCQAKLKEFRHINDIQENCGFSVADEILEEEILEAMEQYLQGNHKECGKELADSIVVLFRMMEMNDIEAKK